MGVPRGSTNNGSQLRRRLDVARALPLEQTVRLAYRKGIYRRVELMHVGVSAGRSIAPTADHGTRLEFWGQDRFEDLLGTSPYLTAEDLDRFCAQKSSAIVALDGKRVVASSWMTTGEVHLSELHRSIHVPADQHYSCRTYVDPAYASRGLMGHMIHAYTAVQPPDDLVWGLVYRSNARAVLSVAKIGWMHLGDYWTTFVFGQPFFGERHFPPRPAVDTARLPCQQAVD